MELDTLRDRHESSVKMQNAENTRLGVEKTELEAECVQLGKDCAQFGRVLRSEGEDRSKLSEYGLEVRSELREHSFEVSALKHAIREKDHELHAALRAAAQPPLEPLAARAPGATEQARLVLAETFVPDDERGGLQALQAQLASADVFLAHLDLHRPENGLAGAGAANLAITETLVPTADENRLEALWNRRAVAETLTSAAAPRRGRVGGDGEGRRTPNEMF